MLRREPDLRSGHSSPWESFGQHDASGRREPALVISFAKYKGSKSNNSAKNLTSGIGLGRILPNAKLQKIPFPASEKKR